MTLSLTLGSAGNDAYTAGAVVLTNTADGRTVRLPVSVQPVMIAVERSVEVGAAGADGTYIGLVTYHDQGPAVPQAPIGLTLVRVVRGRARPVVPAVVPPAPDRLGPAWAPSTTS